LKKLADILYKAELLEIIGSTDIDIENVVFDSREVEKGCLFVAVKGTTTDGHLHIRSAIESGAICIVCENMPKETSSGVTYVKVNDSSYSLSIIASNYFDNPSEKIKLIGITGTNGKTTVATLLYKMFLKFNHNAGLISTVCIMIGNEKLEATHTTPDAVSINRLLNSMVNEGCTHCFMEVSSHAVVQKRIAGLSFAGGVFTNLSQDHLDYHKTFKDYLDAKKAFFDTLPPTSFAVTNVDDKNGWVMLQNTKAGKYSYSLHSMADYRGKIIDNAASGLAMEIMGVETWCKLVGKFNAYNILAVFSTACLLGKNQREVLTILSGLDAVEGRFDLITGPNNVNAIVDYAHTPDALENVLKTLNDINQNKNSRIITVFGCGGNRDSLKRPIMGSVAVRYSHQVIITTDNPRFENPDDITNDILKGVDNASKKKTLVILNRKEAIKTACSIAKDGDIILVAGKGHEKYQEMDGIKHHFDDKEVLMEIFGL
jgi:UDP-N-acetylmuramoyl-L-alanyl-D-glutamate--2,6-diaminopimelate ligase